MRVEELFIKSPGRSDFVQVPNPQQSPLDIQFSSPGQFVVKVQDAGAPPVEYYTVAVVVKGAKLVNMKLKDNNGDVAERKVTILNLHFYLLC